MSFLDILFFYCLVMSTYTISMVGVLGDIKVLTGVAPTVCMDSVMGGVMYVVVPGIYFTWT